MSRISEQEAAEKRIRIDAAIKESLECSPNSVHSIAKQVNEHPSLVYRRFLELGLKPKGGRWVWIGKKNGK